MRERERETERDGKGVSISILSNFNITERLSLFVLCDTSLVTGLLFLYTIKCFIRLVAS